MELGLGTLVGAMFFILLIALLSGVQVTFGLIIVGLIGMYSFLPHSITGDAARQAWNQVNSYSLTAVVMYVFMGEMILKAGISEGIFKAVNKWLGSIAGGLLHSVIGVCAFFAAISGSSVACAASVGGVAIPTMKNRKYDHKLIYGAVGGGGALGILIPPSVIMILYGSLAGVSIAKCFMGGMIPGIIMALLFMVYNYTRVKINPSLTPSKDEVVSWSERLKGSRDIVPILGLAVVLLGGIYFGVFTPTEAAGVGCVLTFFITLAYKKFSWAMLKESSRGTIYTTSMIFMILAGAALVSYVVNYLKIPSLLLEWVNVTGLGPYTVLFLVCVLLYILGCLIDGISICIVLVPVLFPLMTALGFDDIWFGIILTINVEVGLLTPPFGLNLYVIKGIDPDGKFNDIMMGNLPYVGIMTLMILLITLFPSIATWLPNLMIGTP